MGDLHIFPAGMNSFVRSFQLESCKQYLPRHTNKTFFNLVIPLFKPRERMITELDNQCYVTVTKSRRNLKYWKRSNVKLCRCVTVIEYQYEMLQYYIVR